MPCVAGELWTVLCRLIPSTPAGTPSVGRYAGRNGFTQNDVLDIREHQLLVLLLVVQADVHQRPQPLGHRR